MKLILLMSVAAFLWCSPMVAQQSDVVEQIESHLPDGWKCEMSSIKGRISIVASSPTIETISSPYGSGPAGVEEGQVTVSVELIPRYSVELLRRIEKHNKPILKKMKEYPGSKEMPDEYMELKAQLIELAKFQNKDYGFQVSWPTRIPNSEVDRENLSMFLNAISADWEFTKQVEGPDSKLTPFDELVRMHTSRR